MYYKNKVAIVTGGANGIGKKIAEEFARNGAYVAVIDKAECTGFDLCYRGDIAEESVLREFVAAVADKFGGVDYLINNACLSRGGISSCGYEDFLYVQRIGVAAPYMLTKLLIPHFREGAAVVNIASTRAFQSMRETESYSAAKGGIVALTHALAVSLSGKVRVNCISPGWIDTTGSAFSGSDTAQHPSNRVGIPADIASMALYLCGENAGFINGENIIIDGGMSKQMIYHGDHGWKLS